MALSRQGETKARRRLAAQYLFPLVGKLFDDRGNRMTPTVARKNGAHYRYYVSSALAQGRKAEAGTIVPAQPIEEAIQAALSSDPNTTAVADPATGFADIDRVVIRDLLAGRVTSLLDIARREGCSERSIRKNLNLAFLPPALVKAVLDGSAPEGIGVAGLVDAPIVWESDHPL